jgi:hypothetical protein
MNASVMSVAVDSAGNIVFGGLFQGTLAFPAPGTQCEGVCGFVTKVDPSGAFLWGHTYVGHSAGLEGVYLAIGPDDEVVVTGDFAGSTDFGDGPILASDGREVYLVKYAAAGALQWAWHFSGMPKTLIQATDVAVQASGDIVVGGSSPQGLNFGLGMILGGAYLATFDSGGAAKWNKALPETEIFNESGSNHVMGLTPSGDILFAPLLAGDSDFGCGTLAHSSGDPPVALGKFDADGNCVFSEELSGPGLLAARQRDDGIVLAGTNNQQMTVTKLDAAGSQLWTHTYAPTASAGALAVAVDAQTGNIGFTGSAPSGGPLDLGSGMLPGQGNLFAAVLSPAGATLWSARFGDGEPATGSDAAFAPSGLVVGGSYSGTLSFGAPPFQAPGQTGGFIVDFRWQ